MLSVISKRFPIPNFLASLTAGGSPLSQRAQQIFVDHLQRLHRRIDRMFVALMFLQWAFALICALSLSPYTWHGTERNLHPHVWIAILLGGLLTLPVAWAGILYPGQRSTRHLIALCQVGFSSLLIHVMGGRIETHFHVFGSLAFLAAYRDWGVLLPATIFVATDHLIRGLFWPESVFGVATTSNWRWLEHAGWVLFEDLWLVIFCCQGMSEVRAIARQTANSEESHTALAKQTVVLEEALHERGAIVAGALDVIILMDQKGIITGWNAKAIDVFGWTEAEALGRSIAETIIPQSYRQAHREGLDRYLATGIIKLLNQRIEVEGLRRDGTIFPVELAITAIQGSERTSFCAFLRDISERRQAEERLKQAKEAAEAANYAKSLFLANMSHEIRTPLNAILGFTNLIRTSDELAVNDRNSYLEAVHKSGVHLLAVINDILDLSKIEAGQMQYERLRFSPHHVISDVLSLMRVRAAEKGLSLDSRWLGRVPETIESDPARFRQLLLNLVGNAIKFTERGSVQILARVNAIREALQIEVVDTGIGIPANKLESIFAPFSQADISVTRRFGGTGLGLSICRHIVEGLGGQISTQSCEGQGSTFTVSVAIGSLTEIKMLEVPPSEALCASVVSSPESRSRLKGVRVLIVDDGETNRRLLQLLLTRDGATVKAVEHGRAAVQLIPKESFDVVLMDMQMPVMDGYSATRELRAMGIEVPIIALTANAMAGEKEKCLAAGCNGYLTKPVNEEELIATFSKLLDRSPPDPALCRSDLTLTCDEFTSDLDLNDPEIRDIISEFVARLDDFCRGLQTAWEEQNWQELATRSHSLKGTAAMTGFSHLSESVHRLEEIVMRKEYGQIATTLEEIESLVTNISAKYAVQAAQ